MSKEQYEKITAKLQEVKLEIEALPESASEHLCRYAQLKGVTK